MTRASAVFALAGALAASAGCSSGITPAAPRAFNRPDRVGFACVDVTSTTDPIIAPLAECRTLTDGTYPVNRRLLALVTQTARGEVAAVDLTARTILDSDRRIPGFTFVPVDELPTDIVVPAVHASCAWVSSGGRRTLTAISLQRFRPEHGDDTADFETRVALPSRPARMALSPDERTIWLSFPDLSAVGRVAIDPDRCTAGAVDLVELSVDVPPGVVEGPQVDAPRLCAPDGFELAEPAVITPREYVADDPAPRPSELVVDAQATAMPLTGPPTAPHPELLVADRNLPLIHRVDMLTGELLAPLATGAPIRDLAVTPGLPYFYETPAAAPGTGREARFLYAIDDVDGTVMVLDISGNPLDPTNTGYGAVISVNVEGASRPDRISFTGAARAVDIVLPNFDPDPTHDPRVGTVETTDRIDPLCDFTRTPLVTPSPLNLRGAFAMFAMADASVRVVDLYDLHATCRGRSFGDGTPPDPDGLADCSSPSVPSDIFVAIRRHRPRGGSFLQVPVRLSGSPQFLVGGAQLDVEDNGVSGGSTAVLDEIDCPAGLAAVFPLSVADAARGRVCTINDPYAAVTETWVAAWQGTIPNTASTGNFEDRADGTVALETALDVCSRGVLARAGVELLPVDGEPESPLRGIGGDTIAITTRISDTLLRDSTICRGVVGIDNFGQAAEPIVIAIDSATARPDDLLEPYTSRLSFSANASLLDPATGLLPASTDPQFGLTLGDARDCLGDVLVNFDIRPRGSYVVTGVRSTPGATGFLHRVVRDDVTAECVVDPTLPRSRIGRAFHGVPFVGPRISFQLSLPPGTLTILGTELRISVAGVPAPMGLDLGALSAGGRALALPSEIVWSDLTSHAFVIDPARRGLVELEMAPLRVVTNTRYE